MEKFFVLVVFCLTYYLIISGKYKRSTVAFAAGMLIILSRVIQEFHTSKIGEYIDFNTIGILIGMMIVVGILRTTGFFEFVAVNVVRITKGNVRLMFAGFMFTIALFSAFLDNVTTILLFAPIIFLVADSMNVSPTPFIMASVLCANIGGTATMIGDPPNILIGSASGFGFFNFITSVGPVALVALVAGIIYLDRKIFSKYSKNSAGLSKLAKLDASKTIKSKKELYKALGVFCGVIIGFLLHETLDYEAATIALAGAAVALLISGKDFSELAHDIEWDTIFFFIGLFMLSYALQAVGISDVISSVLAGLAAKKILLFITVLWIAAVAGGFIGAVPTVTVMLPIIGSLVRVHGISPDIWWALSVGACFGGSMSITGAAANMVGVGLVEKHTRKKFGYYEYLKAAMPLTLVTLIIGTIYIIFRYAV